MREELEKKLVEDYPELFSDHGGDPMHTCMAWGCECGDGWEPVIRALCVTLNRQGSANLKVKTVFPEMRKLKVWFHNLCRKLEDRFEIKPYSLYSMSYPKYQNFGGFRVKFAQIKEKFGELRIYTDIYDNHTPEEAALFSKKDIEEHLLRFRGYVNGAVCFAESLSSVTCEYCGEPGKISREGWWKTLCENCKNKK